MRYVATAPANTKYLSEFFDDLPHNGHFNKVTTGSGATSLALSNGVNYVIAMPYVSLIENKTKWCADKGIEVLAIHASGSRVSDIATFTGSKIMVTYDQLEAVTKALPDPKDWKVMVDEAHILVTSAGFRRKAVQGVLDSYKMYGSFVFVTATPMEGDDQLPALRDIDEYSIIWPDLKDVAVEYTHSESTADLYRQVAMVMNKHVSQQITGNAHIFVNSVDSILKLLGFSKPTNVRIVCADKDTNQEAITTFNEANNTNYVIGSVDSAASVLNFYTSTAFEGVDVYDVEGRNYIVVDGNKDSTKIDIGTTLSQIIGRVRDSIYKSEVKLFYTNNSMIASKTAEEYRAIVEEILVEKEGALNIVAQAKTLNLTTVSNPMADVFARDSYYYEDGKGEYKVNLLAKHSEMVNWKNIHRTYCIINGSISDGTKVVNQQNYNYAGVSPVAVTGFEKVKLGKKANASDLVKEYIEAVNNGDTKKVNSMAILEPWIKEAYDTLGESALGTLKYQKGKIKTAMIAADNTRTIEQKVNAVLKFRMHTWIPAKEMKEVFTKVYADLGLHINAKGTDADKYYVTETKDVKVKGTTTKCIRLVANKY